MRKVIVRQARQPEVTDQERLVSLLATGLQRLLEKDGVRAPRAVDFGAGQSVTTTCPNGGGEEMPT